MFPAEKILVTRRAFVMCGRTEIPMFCIATTVYDYIRWIIADHLVVRWMSSGDKKSCEWSRGYHEDNAVPATLAKGGEIGNVIRMFQLPIDVCIKFKKTYHKD